MLVITTETNETKTNCLAGIVAAVVRHHGERLPAVTEVHDEEGRLLLRVQEWDGSDAEIEAEGPFELRHRRLHLARMRLVAHAVGSGRARGQHLLRLEVARPLGD